MALAPGVTQLCQTALDLGDCLRDSRPGGVGQPDRVGGGGVSTPVLGVDAVSGESSHPGHDPHRPQHSTAAAMLRTMAGRLVSLLSLFAGVSSVRAYDPSIPEIEADGARLFGGSDWHADITFRKPGGHLSFLHAVILPPVGGDTGYDLEELEPDLELDFGLGTELHAQWLRMPIADLAPHDLLAAGP